jgi:hypothetical protein
VPWECSGDLVRRFIPRQMTNQSVQSKYSKDMLRYCVLSWQGSWEDHLPLVDFAYNNSYQVSI